MAPPLSRGDVRRGAARENQIVRGGDRGKTNERRPSPARPDAALRRPEPAVDAGLAAIAPGGERALEDLLVPSEGGAARLAVVEVPRDPAQLEPAPAQP